MLVRKANLPLSRARFAARADGAFWLTMTLAAGGLRPATRPWFPVPFAATSPRHATRAWLPALLATCDLGPATRAWLALFVALLALVPNGFTPPKETLWFASSFGTDLGRRAVSRPRRPGAPPAAPRRQWAAEGRTLLVA